MIKKISFLLVILVSFSVYSQSTNLDTYKYIVVADKFDFLNEADKYQTSSLTKFLLAKKGFKVFLSNEKLPDELIRDRCLSLFAEVKDKSNFLTFKTEIEIKDCFDKVLYTSQVGKSKFKNYKKGYQESIRNAFESMEDFQYSYNPNLTSNQNEAKKEEIIAKNISNNVVKSVTTIPKVIVAKESEKEEVSANDSLITLYAQTTENGFQLVNTKPEVVFVLLKTNVKDTFIIKDKNGSFYKNGDLWLAEYYEGNKLVKKLYKVKF